ncbi:MAG: flagellar biosynthetic protein FliO [Calothrix sp. SM1_5_4]|nr:flagellar biosynthetic protein FliO [Calothrix sp. SM1_5_4]
MRAAETLIQENAESAPIAPVRADQPESQIPVVLTPKIAAKTETNTVWRLVASVALVAVVGGALFLASRRWARGKDKGGQKARIEILHQFHLGPRKSLALIRVAGETMLVGITDHNINMLKSIALIDDELEGVFKKDFNGFLEDEFSIEDVRSALGSRV